MKRSMYCILSTIVLLFLTYQYWIERKKNKALYRQVRTQDTLLRNYEKESSYFHNIWDVILPWRR